MRFSGSRHPDFNLDGGRPQGPTTIIRAAKDPVRVPEDKATVDVIERCLCRVELGEDCYVVTGLTGDKRTVPYGAPLSKWEEVCDALLKLAVNSETLFI